MSRSVADLHPDLQPLAWQFLKNCLAAGLEVILTTTYRSKEEQDALYAKGRTEEGPKVTNAKGGESPHNCTLPDGTPAALAFDFALYAPGTRNLDWDANDEQWETAIEIGRSLGLISGSTFHGIADFPHMEMPLWKTRRNDGLAGGSAATGKLTA